MEVKGVHFSITGDSLDRKNKIIPEDLSVFREK